MHRVIHRAGRCKPDRLAGQPVEHLPRGAAFAHVAEIVNTHGPGEAVATEGLRQAAGSKVPLENEDAVAHPRERTRAS
jgi:hypothetical protein